MRADLHPSLKEALLDAAEATIATRGLSALRARDLADTAGCALGMIYKLFPNLDALILDVNSRTLAMLEPALQDSGSLDASDCVVAGDRPEVLTLAGLALAYFDFAVAHQLRWRALFEHRLAPGGVVPEWHLAEHRRLFGYVERPLRSLLPDAPDETLVLLGRSLFSAVHGVVSLGLDEKLVSMPRDVLRRHTGLIAASAARGLALAGSLEMCG